MKHREMERRDKADSGAAPSRAGGSEKKLTVVGVIPARMESERLPGKVLRPICGRPMIHRVYDAARACDALSELWVATDSAAVSEYCAANGIAVMMTSRAHRSGTERVHEVMQKRSADRSAPDVFAHDSAHDIYVNIQGDEPMLQPSHLDLLIEPFLRHPQTRVTTLKTPLAPDEAANPNVVKVVSSPHGGALYFSRAAIPYRRNSASTVPCYKHLGFYAYRAEALRLYVSLPVSPLEETERLEQLRFLENGIPMHVAETPFDTIGVDTEDDLLAVTRYFERHSKPR
jgi:3-deoxy-manno-octulosonate cytidylyltransferase (CMP-KDO synthetase)